MRLFNNKVTEISITFLAIFLSVAMPLTFSSAWAADIEGTDGDDMLPGTKNKDSIWGKDGDDTLWGKAKSDNLYGQKGDDEIRKMAEGIMDKVVDQLLNEAAEIVLKED